MRHLAAVLLSLILAAAAWAQDPAQKASDEFRRRLVKLVDRRAELRRIEKKLQKELSGYEGAITASGQRIDTLARRQADLPGRLAVVKARLQRTSYYLAKARAGFGQRVRLLYLHGADASYHLWASAPDLNSYLSRAMTLTLLLEAQKRAQTRLQSGHQRLKMLQRQLDLYQQDLAAIKLNAQTQRVNLQKLRGKRLALLGVVRRQNKLSAETLGALREAQARLARTFALAPAAGSAQRGSLVVEGRLMPRARSGQRGVVLAARPGAPVRSPWRARVAYADRLAGYGRVVVLEHPDRMHTVMAYLGTVSVEADQHLVAGQVVGAVGRSGRLYLEVRRGTKPVKPETWLDLAP